MSSPTQNKLTYRDNFAWLSKLLQNTIRRFSIILVRIQSDSDHSDLTTTWSQPDHNLISKRENKRRIARGRDKLVNWETGRACHGKSTLRSSYWHNGTLYPLNTRCLCRPWYIDLQPGDLHPIFINPHAPLLKVTITLVWLLFLMLVSYIKCIKL